MSGGITNENGEKGKPLMEVLDCGDCGEIKFGNEEHAVFMVGQYRAALIQCIKVARDWHGPEAFDIYYNNAPEMKLIREAIPWEEVKDGII